LTLLKLIVLILAKLFVQWGMMKLAILLDIAMLLCYIDTLFFFHRDGKMPVSFIQKYLVKKLDLTSEAEVCLSFLPCQKVEDV
jgi:hypothetical protein